MFMGSWKTMDISFLGEPIQSSWVLQQVFTECL